MRVVGGAVTAIVLLILSTLPAAPQTAKGSHATVNDAPLVDVLSVDPTFVIALYWAREDNVFKTRFYPPEMRCQLRQPVAARLASVQQRLKPQGLRLKIWDAFRPYSVSVRMFEVVKDAQYVADPKRGSKHNRGAAVDVTVVDQTGTELEMPSAYCDFTERAHRSYAGCSDTARSNRRLLEDVMTTQGFLPYEAEWWHFNDPEWMTYPVIKDATP